MFKLFTIEVEKAPQTDWMALLDKDQVRARLDQICSDIVRNSEFKQDVAGIRKDLSQQVTTNTDRLLNLELDLKFAKRQITDLERTSAAWQGMTLDLAEKVADDRKKATKEAPKGKKVYFKRKKNFLRKTSD